MNNPQIEVIAWWYGRRDYNTGISLLSKYSKNKIIVHSLNKPGKSNFLAFVQKLNYEVTKAVDFDWLHMPKDPWPEIQKLENIPVGITLQDPDISGKLALPDASFPLSQKDIPVDLNQYPKVIRRLKYEYAELYKKRSILHTEMRSTDEKNTEKNITLRKTLLLEIKSISKNLQYYWAFIDAFEKKGIVPDEENIWPADVPATVEEPKTLAQLKHLKQSLQSETAKDRSRLLYQQRTKGEKENPMPKGPKRDAIKLRVKLREQKMNEIIKQIADLEDAA